jgi:hypothetical protein
VKRHTRLPSLRSLADRRANRGSYERIKILGELYAETLDPTLIYNQGRCYQQNRRPEDAIARFQEYLRKAKELPEAERAEVEGFIRELEAEAKARSGSPQDRSKIGEAVPSVAAAASHGDRGRSLRIAGLAVGSAGVVALIAAVYLSVKVASLEDEVTQYAREHTRIEDRPALNSRLADGGRFETWQFISYGVAAGALATGATLFVLGSRAGRSPDEASVSLVPLLGARGGGAILHARF